MKESNVYYILYHYFNRVIAFFSVLTTAMTAARWGWKWGFGVFAASLIIGALLLWAVKVWRDVRTL